MTAQDIEIATRRDCQAVVTGYLNARVRGDDTLAGVSAEILQTIPPERRGLTVQFLAIAVADAIQHLAHSQGVDPLELWQHMCARTELGQID